MRIGISFCRNRLIRLKHATKNVRRTVQLTDTHVCLWWPQKCDVNICTAELIFGWNLWTHRNRRKLFTFTQHKIPVGIVNSGGPYLEYKKCTLVWENKHFRTFAENELSRHTCFAAVYLYICRFHESILNKQFWWGILEKSISNIAVAIWLWFNIDLCFYDGISLLEYSKFTILISICGCFFGSIFSILNN